MDKLNISTFPGCVEKTLEYIKTALKALHVSAADSEALLGSAGENTWISRTAARSSS